MNQLKQLKDTNIKKNYSPHAIRHGRIKGRPKHQSQTLGREGIIDGYINGSMVVKKRYQ